VSPIPIHNDKTAPKPPASTSKATDLKSFQQSHPAANPATTATVRRGTAPNVGVNVTNLVNTLNQGGRGAAHPTASSGTSDDYVKKLIARLHDALKLPGGISGLSADVSLKIAADGTVVSAVLERASGNDQFDAAVQTALQEITQVEPPPGGKEVTYLFTYVPPAP
jgi:TonB family protein